MDDIKRRADRLRELERERGERPDDPVVVDMGPRYVMCKRDAAHVKSEGGATAYWVEPDPAIVSDICITDVTEVR